MTLISFLLVLAVVGLIVWAITLIPMPQVFKNLIIGIAILFVVVYTIQQLGVKTGLPQINLFK